MNIGFSVRGTKGGNVTVTFNSGREASISPYSGDETSNLIAEAYFAAHPNGEVVARGTITVSAEVE